MNAKRFLFNIQDEESEMAERPSYRQTRSLENIGEVPSIDDWYRDNGHLIFINENINENTMTVEASSNNHEVLER